MDRPILSYGRIFAISGSMVGFQLAYVVVYGLVDPIMTKIGINDFAKNAAWGIGPVIGFIFQPLTGYYSDRSRNRFGRRRPFIIVGSVLTSLCFLALYLVQKYYMKLSKGLNTFFILLIVALVMLSMNIYQGPSRAIIGDILHPSQQELGYTVGTVLTGVASIASSLLGGIGYFAENKWLTNNMTSMMLIIGASAVIITMLFTVFAAKEEQFTGEVEDLNFFKSLLNALKNMPKPISRIAFCLAFSQAAFFPYATKMTTFFSNEVFPESESSKGLCFGMLSFAVVYTIVMIYGCFHVKVTECIGHKSLYFISMAIMSVSFGSVLFTLNKWLLFGFLAPAGISFLVFNTIPFSIVGLVSKATDMCTYMSLLNNFIIFGQLAGIIMIAVVNAITGAIPNCYDHVKKNQAVIGSGAIFGIMSTIGSLWIIEPEISKNIDPTPLI